MKLGFSIKICIENVFDLRTLETVNRCEAWTSSEENSFIHLGLEKCSELLSQDETINSGKYCNQFDKLKNVIVEKQSKLANRRGYHDNVKPHIALTVREKLLKID